MHWEETPRSSRELLVHSTPYTVGSVKLCPAAIRPALTKGWRYWQGIPFAYDTSYCGARIPDFQTCFSSPLPLHVCGQAAMLAQRDPTTATRPLIMRAGRKPYQLQKGASGHEWWRGRKGFHGWGETASAETNARTWNRIEA